MKQKFFISILAVLVLFSEGISQQKKPTNAPGGADPSGEISGVLIDAKSGKPVEYGNFVIYRKKDNALVNGTVSDVTGAFKLTAVPYGFYTAEITFIGYDKVTVDSIMVTPKTISVNLGTIKINPAGLTTDEVLVTGEKDGIINNLDKIVINVDKNIASAGGNAADVLRNVPAVTVDIDGNLTLRGNGNVKILIDGRPANTGGQSIGDILASIPAGSIESIELVTNPSAKYDAEGTAGIVNIKLKKKSNLGINGMISSTVGTNDKYNSSVNLNYKLEHINFFGNFDFRINNFVNDGSSTRFASYPGFTNSLEQSSSGNFTMNMNNYNLGFDYFVDDFNTLTLQGNYRKFSFDNAFKSLNTSISSNSPTEVYQRYSEGERSFQNQNYSLNYKRSFLDKNTELTADVTYSRNDVTLGSFANIDKFNNSAIDRTKNDSKNKFEFLVGSVNFTLPLFDNTGKMETGIKSTIRDLNSEVDYFTGDPGTNNWIYNSNLSNIFKMKEQIHAAFLIYTGSFGDFKYQAGIRAENTTTEGNTDKTNVNVNKNYTDFFPSVYLTWAPAMAQEIKANYSRRVDRPNPRQINPFIDNTDSLNISYGNPNLDPQFTDSYELGYSLFMGKLNFMTSLFYRQTNGAINYFTRLGNNGTTESTWDNIATQKSTGFEVSAGGEILPGFRLNPSFSYFRTQVNGQSGITTIASDDYSWNAKIISSLNLFEGASMQLFFNYNAPNVSGQGRTDEMYFMDLAYKQDFFDGNLSLSIRVSDLFNTMKWNMTTTGTNFDLSNYRKNDSRNVYVGLTYIFNSFKKQQRKPSEGGMDENAF
ncbi:outer membrane beta-barrel family protein [Ignavibacteriales bacterium]